MIRLAQSTDAEQILTLCRKDAWDGTAVWSDFTAKQKGADTWGYCDIWLGFDDASPSFSYILCRHAMLYRLIGRPSSLDSWQELYDFLKTLPEGCLTAEYTILEKYSGIYPVPQPLPKYVRMICEKPVSVAGMDEVSICTDFGKAYDVRALQSSGFAAHITREEYIRTMEFSVSGNNHVFELQKNGKPVAEGCIILCKELPYGLITDIYTMPLERGRGYAEQMVARLCSEAIVAGKVPVLDCDSVKLEQYYGKFGFQTCGYWSEYPIPVE